jgi:hypothetical protein
MLILSVCGRGLTNIASRGGGALGGAIMCAWDGYFQANLTFELLNFCIQKS